MTHSFLRYIAHWPTSSLSLSLSVTIYSFHTPPPPLPAPYQTGLVGQLYKHSSSSAPSISLNLVVSVCTYTESFSQSGTVIHPTFAFAHFVPRQYPPAAVFIPRKRVEISPILAPFLKKSILFNLPFLTADLLATVAAICSLVICHK